MAHSNEEKVEKSEKHNGIMAMISFVSLIIVLLFIVEIYEIFNDPNNLIAIGALGVFILAAVYAETVLIRKLSISKMKEQKEAYNNIYRSEKASYLLLRKYFDQMDQKLGKIEKLSDVSYDDLIASQKALAKVQINRGKENTSVLMKANNRILDKLNTLQRVVDTIERAESTEKDTMQFPEMPEMPEISDITKEDTSFIPTGLSEEDKEIITNANREVLAKQQEILSNIKEMEHNLRNDILDSSNKLTSLKQQMESQKKATVPEQVLDSDFKLEPIVQEEDSFQNNQVPDRQTSKNSSEMDLDQLLKEVGSDVSAEDNMIHPLDEEPQIEPMMGDADLQPIIEEPSLEPTLNDSDLQPIVEEPQIGPMMGDVDLQPITEEPSLEPTLNDLDLQPIVEKPQIEPMMGDADLQPIIEEPSLEPTLNDLDLQPIVEEPQIGPMMGDVDLQPITEEPSLEPTLNDLDLQPIVEEPQIEPMMSDVDLQPIVEQPSVEPILNDLDLQPIVEEPQIEPMMGDVDLQPIAEEPSLETILSDADLQPIVEEPQIEPMMGDLDLQPIVEETSLETILKEPDLQSIAEEPQLESILDEPTLSSLGEEPQLQSMMNDIDLQPIVEEPSLETVLNDADSQPIVEEPQLESILNEPDLTFSNEELESKPTQKDLSAMRSQKDLEMQSMLDALVSQEASNKNLASAKKEIPSIQDEMKGTPVLEESDGLLDTSEKEIASMQNDLLSTQQESTDIQSVLNDKEEFSLPDSDESAIDSIVEGKDLLSEKTEGAADPYVMTPDDLAALIDEAGFDFDDLDDENPKTETRKPKFTIPDDESDDDFPPIVNEFDLRPVKPVAEMSMSEIEPDQEINQISQEELDQFLGNSDSSAETKSTTLDFNFSKPGHVMSPDEIAALIANTDTLPEKESGKERATMPDLQDSGHVMSSDEIAALIANL